jgi:PAS domain S-box-containing protein
MAENSPQIESQSKSSDSQFRRLVQAVTDYAIYMLNPDGIITSWNAGAERIKGYAEADVIGQHFSRFFTPEDRAAGKPERALKTARETGRFEDEGWRVRKDGSRFWALAVLDAIRDADGNLVGFAKITRDMTERRAAAEALAESERRFRLLVTSVVDYALFMLNREGYVTNWNPGAQRIKGYTPDEIIGRHFSVFYAEEDRAAGIPAKALETAAREGKFETEAWRMRKDGSRFWANVVIDPIRDESGNLLGFAKITRDISDRRALEQAKEQLHQSQKMETVGQLTGGVAHDFNNLLQVIRSNLEALERNPPSPESVDADRHARWVRSALRGVDRAAALTHRLLAFARQQPLEPKPLDPNKLVGGMSDLLRRTLGETIAIETVLAGGLWRTFADPNQVESAILNLAVNARDAMPEGGQLTIETANTYLDEAYAGAHQEVTPGQYVMIAVTDTGTGMSKETVAKAFEPFFTTKDIGKGTGLGLSQVYGFVKQSGGHVKIYSELGEGTTVRIYLPRYMAQEKMQEEAAAASAVPTGTYRETILVVEDDEDVRASSVETLRELGYRVLEAPDGAAALSVLEREPAVRLLFTDVGLPGGMNGRQLADEARRRRPALQVLFTTGYARNALVHHGRLDPGVELIVKPFTYAALAAKIRALLEADGRC